MAISAAKLNIYGLGYVGSVTSACLADLGHTVTGVEIVPAKLKRLQEGEPPVFEPGLTELFRKVLRNFTAVGTIAAATDADASIVCVGTPSLADRSVDLQQVKQTAVEIGDFLRTASRPHHVIFRSTVPPGTTEDVLVPLLEKRSGRRRGRDFFVCFYPEFLREGQALRDFLAPSLNVVGGPDPESYEFVQAVFRVDAPLSRVSTRSAEMLKYACNGFHALKVAFGNEMGTLCRSLGVDADEVMRSFVMDRRLNISAGYLSPGFAFGGPCLPKELRAIGAMAEGTRVSLPLMDSVLSSNREHVSRLISLIEKESTTEREIGFLGATYKPDTDDLRESPFLEVFDHLLRAPSYQPPWKISVCDGVEARSRLSELYGKRIALLESPAQLFDRCRTVVLGPLRIAPEELAPLSAFRGTVIDLKFHRLPPAFADDRTDIRTIC